MVLKIHNREFNLNDDIKTYAQLHKRFYEACISSAIEFEKKYYKCDCFDKLWEVFQLAAVGTVQSQCESACSLLFNMGVFTVDTDDFIRKYYFEYMDIDPYIEPLVEKLSQISSYASELSRIRNIKNASRGHWVGGGFGIQGAITGAVTASAFNAVGSVVHGIGSILRESSDDSKIRKLKKEVFDDSGTFEIMANAIVQCGMGAFYGLIDEMISNNRIKPIDIRPKDAQTISRNALKYATDRQKLLDLLVESVFLDPFNCELYTPLFDLFSDLDGLNEFAEYFGIASAFRYRKQNRINAKLKAIDKKWGNGVKDQCAKIIDLSLLAQEEGIDLDIRIWDIAKKLKKDNEQSSKKLGIVLMKFDEYYPGTKPPKAQEVIRDIEKQWEILQTIEEKDSIDKMSVENVNEATLKLRALINFGKRNSRNVSKDIICVLQKAIKVCRDQKDIVNLQENVASLRTSNYPQFEEIVSACGYKMSMYNQEALLEWHLVHIFSPVILDIITLAREGSAAHQLWLVMSICPDVIMAESNTEHGNRIDEFQQFIPENLADTIAFLFDEPQKYPFDLFMRIRINLISEPQQEYCDSLEGFAECEKCPAGMYEFGKYALLSGRDEGLASIENAAICGYYPAITLLQQMSQSEENKLNHSTLFYDVLAAGKSTYGDLYKYRYQKATDYTKTLCLLNIFGNLSKGHTSLLTNGVESIVQLIEAIWQTGYKASMELNIHRIGFHKSEKEDPHILEAVKFLGLRLHDETPVFSFITDWRAHDKRYKYKDQEVFLLTTKGAYWNKGDQVYLQKYETIHFNGCYDFPAYYKTPTHKMWWQCFSIVYYASVPYRADIKQSILEKMAMCGNPLAICRLLSFTNIGEDRREMWLDAKQRWEKCGHRFEVCPNCGHDTSSEMNGCQMCRTKV